MFEQAPSADACELRNRITKLQEVLTDFKQKPPDIQEDQREELVDFVLGELEICDELLLSLPQAERHNLIDQVYRNLRDIGLAAQGVEVAKKVAETLIELLS